MRKIVIFTSSFLQPHTKELIIGGLEKYIKDLARLCVDNGYETIIYQIVPSDIGSYETERNGFRVKFVPSTEKSVQKRNKTVFDYVYKKENDLNTLFIIATDCMRIKSRKKNVVVIQHGISFDDSSYKKDKLKSRFWRIKHHIGKFYGCYLMVQNFYNVINTICVDYNYFNWFRTLGTIYPETQIKVIPNYSETFITQEELQSKINRIDEHKKIIFARRFYDYRGTLLFKEVAKRLLIEFPNIVISFAGDGPLRKDVEESFIGEPRVKIFSYEASKSVEIHKEYDIAVIPTIFSEGTSLALCESMAAGCFPIATHVGGMTNIILDGYNGFLVYPDTLNVYNACKKALTLNKDEFSNICINAYMSASRSFSYKKWSEEWCDFLSKQFATS